MSRLHRHRRVNEINDDGSVRIYCRVCGKTFVAKPSRINQRKEVSA